MPGEALFYLMVQNVMVNTVLTFGKSVLEHVMVGSLVIGIWIANTSWRSRKYIWQMQSALIGGSVGFVIGRLSSKNS